MNENSLVAPMTHRERQKWIGIFYLLESQGYNSLELVKTTIEDIRDFKIIKSMEFYGEQCDFYKNKDNEIFMTVEQLAKSLDYSSKSGIEKIVQRNKYLDTIEFSVTDKLSATDGKRYNTRLFNEDGIYEVTMLAKTDKAREFRSFVRKTIKSLRKGEFQPSNNVVQAEQKDVQLMKAEVSLKNAKIKEANLLLKLADRTDRVEQRRLLTDKAIELMTGTY